MVVGERTRRTRELELSSGFYFFTRTRSSTAEELRKTVVLLSVVLLFMY
jgi:hypothetical protein